jgi:L-alanine-DL-glutamate epimerase-like enolase superfamily enzyme
MTCETVTGQGGWMDQLLSLDIPYIERGFIHANDKPGLGVDLNPDVVRAHLVPGESWWG